MILYSLSSEKGCRRFRRCFGAPLTVLLARCLQSRCAICSQEEKASRANKSPQLPPVGAICLDRRLMPGIIHPGNNTLLLNEA